jgi:cell division protein FtsZ
MTQSKRSDLPEIADPLYGAPSVPATPTDPVPRGTTAVRLPELPGSFEEPSVAVSSSAHEDLFDSAMRMAFIGAGQGGGRIAQAFWDLGYRRVVAVNTTDQDLESLTIEKKMVIGGGARGGAGKDPSEGTAAARESFEDIMDLMLRSWGEKVEQVYVCVGAGGGSGTGSWPILVDAVREYCKSTNIEKPLAQHIGVIMTIPKRSEGARVQANGLAALNQALQMLEAKKISSLILVDNARIHELFPGLPVKKFWQVANQNFAAVLHTLNLLAAQKSEYSTFDKADFRSIVRNGLMIFGMTRVAKWQGKEDISQAIRQNLKGTLLAEGFDLSTAKMAGAVVVAHDDIMAEVPMENLDYAMNSLGRALGNEGVTLHSGIYEGAQPGMRVFTIISGLEAPTARLAELEQLAK